MLKRNLTQDDVCIELYPQNEDSPIRHPDSSNTAEAIDFIRAVQEVQEKAPIWGWCTAVVKVSWGAFEVKQYLGECSYYGPDDFKDNSGYYENMVQEALTELNGDIKQVLDDLHAKGCI